MNLHHFGSKSLQDPRTYRRFRHIQPSHFSLQPFRAGSGEPDTPRIAVAMSGGLDSSVAAAVLVEQGFQVIGVTAHMWKDGSRCCSVEDVRHAQRVAFHLNIPHFVLNATRDFRAAVVDPFLEEYASGRTPSPCVNCNEWIKFGFLLRRAAAMGCSKLATGHYACLEEHDGSYSLTAGHDRSKDQAYFLHRLTQEKLAHCLFPLGAWTKQQVREYAERHKLPPTRRSESQDLCFVPPDRYAEFVEQHRPDLKREGRILDENGRTLGEHCGIHRFTVGQRRGLGVASTEPLYVHRLDVADNTVTIAPRNRLFSKTLTALNVNWIAGCAPSAVFRCDVRIRYRHRQVPAAVHVREDGMVQVEFDKPQFAVTPGQAAVFYEGDRVLGGGWID